MSRKVKPSCEFLAQLAHEHVNYFHFRLVYPAVEVVQEHFLGQCHALAQRKELQHLVLLSGKMHARAVDLGRLGVEVDYEVAGLDHRLGVAPRAAHDGKDARDQFFLVEWLGHVVVGAEAETLDLVLDSGNPGEDQGRRPHLRSAPAAQHFKARHVRQVEVEKNGAMLLDLPGPALRLLTDVADFHFSDIAVRGDDGARAIGANDDAAAVELRGRRRQYP